MPILTLPVTNDEATGVETTTAAVVTETTAVVSDQPEAVAVEETKAVQKEDPGEASDSSNSTSSSSDSENSLDQPPAQSATTGGGVQDGQGPRPMTKEERTNKAERKRAELEMIEARKSHQQKFGLEQGLRREEKRLTDKIERLGQKRRRRKARYNDDSDSESGKEEKYSTKKKSKRN